MTKQLLTLGIIFSLGAVGCAGFGAQQASSLPAQIRLDEGVDGLWMSAERTPSKGLEAPHYSGEGLGGLWDAGVPTPTPVSDRGYFERRTGGDLWNPASVTRTWDTRETRAPRPASRGYIFSDVSGRRGRHLRAAQ
jgi:hypothetical protein